MSGLSFEERENNFRKAVERRQRAAGRVTDAMVERAAEVMHEAYQPDEGDDLDQCWREAMRTALTAALGRERP